MSTTIIDHTCAESIENGATAATATDLCGRCQYLADNAPQAECHAARTTLGYWTCDVPGGCSDCRAIAAANDDADQLATWNADTAQD